MSLHSEIPPDLNTPPKRIPLQSLQQRYQIISNLGNGSFGTVELAKYRLDKKDLLRVSDDKKGTLLEPLWDSQVNNSNLVAIKTMNRQLPTLHDYTRIKEVKFILSIGSHPCLVQIYEMFIDDINFQLHIAMESMNQNLYQLMKARKDILFSPITLRSILSQILCAIRHIHRHNYFHRDVKPENILVIPSQHYYGSKEAIPPYRRDDNFVVKLADYGLARNVNNAKPYTGYVSTRWYRSPEILLRQKYYSKPIDIWAFGAVACEVANFSPLLPGSNELDQIWRTLKVLGSPVPADANSVHAGSIPMGGFWLNAQTLASRLGFIFPADQGMQILDILPSSDHKELSEVVRACLVWDPSLRADVDRVCSMSYFRDTLVSSENREMLALATSRKLERNTVTPTVGLGAIRSSDGNRVSKKTKLASETWKKQPVHEAMLSPTKILMYDDLDDGYENEFMNTSALSKQDHKDLDEFIIGLEEESQLPNAHQYDYKEASVISLDKPEFSHNARSYHSSRRNSRTETPERDSNANIPRSLQVIQESIYTELDLLAETSFDSGHEINVNS
ncbi:kinase-like domain-containing protein [Scheffersomyces xylosifermentans]|uniref:kinase-like domain-containing protein n=1 Tax=Scheffersomyces xylosifermentans TaxID=1304137 RepID=UPI00315D2D84